MVAWTVLLSCSMGTAIAQPLAISSVGLFNFSGSPPSGMSGITYAGGNQYYAVEDSGARLYPLTISVDPMTGAVLSATASSMIALGGTDLEGVAYNPFSNSVYVSDESGPGIREYDLSGGLLNTITVPAIYNNIVANNGFESLSLQAGHQSLWTANEQALTVDGPVSSTGNSTTVRLQKFDSNLAPAGQWAYVTAQAFNQFPTDASEQVGVVDMLILPNGKVLVLERRADASFTGLRFDNFIYEVDFSLATDVSGFANLSGGGFTPVSKTLLWDSPWFESGTRNNFEGMTLGPQLANGNYSILLISDGDDVSVFPIGESLYALQLSGDIGGDPLVVPEPGTWVWLFVGVGVLLLSRRVIRCAHCAA